MATFSWAVNHVRVFLAMGEPPLEIVAYSCGPFFPFRLKQNNVRVLLASAIPTLGEVQVRRAEALLTSPVFGFSRDLDDQRQQILAEAPILMGFSVISAPSGTIAIESAGEPLFGTHCTHSTGPLEWTRVEVTLGRSSSMKSGKTSPRGGA